MEILKKICSTSSLKYVAAFLVPAIFAIVFRHVLDNDSWGVLAEGRYIVENGLYTTDVLSIHGNPIIVANYAFAVCFWWIHSVFGAAGIYIAMLMLNFVVCWLIYKICMLISKRNVNLSLVIMLFTDLLLVFVGFVVTRAQMVTFMMMLSVIYLLELYISSGKIRYLWGIPIISLIQVNFHAAYWWMPVAIMVAYLIDSIRKPEWHLQGYRAKPLLVVLFVYVACGFINPYGAQTIIEVFAVYFNGALNNLVVELQSFSPFMSVEYVMVYLAIVVVAFLYLVGNKKGVRMRYFLMFFGFLALSLNTIKAFSQFILVMAFPLALMYRKAHIERMIDAKIARDAICRGMGVFCTGVFVGLIGVMIVYFPQEPDEALVAAVNAIDADVIDAGEADKSVLKVYTGYNIGGYLQYRGYRTYLDPRGNMDITEEWVKCKNGEIKPEELLEKYKFDYLSVEGAGDPFYDFENDACEKIFDSEGGSEAYRCKLSGI